ncbi:transcriptional regulator [Lactiplantibacillus plantarum]|nr:transcriptional regulator [Lactiplantibacillus plantarum]
MVDITMFERVKELSKKHGKSLKQVATELGFGENYFYTWKKKSPGIDKVQKVANYFNVSIDYLLGNEVEAPSWATEDDKIDLDEWLKSNVPMGFQGMDMDDETKIKVRAFLEGVFWEDKQKHRNDDNKK